MQQILIVVIAVLTSGLCSLPSSAIAQQTLVVKALAEKKLTELPTVRERCHSSTSSRDRD